jgi:hypothetical protein
MPSVWRRPERTRLLRSLHRPVMNREGDGVALLEGHDLRAALHTRPLLGQHELAAREVLSRLREQNDDLDRERELAVEILVKAVEVTFDILE